jgi:uncharacterized protein with HEPN domain
MKDDSVIIARICDSADKIMRAVSGRSEEEFVAVETTPAAVVLWLTQIGEMAKRLSKTTKEMYDLPWRDITGFRDMAVHEYFELSLPDVYLTATRDIPEVLKVLRAK